MTPEHTVSFKNKWLRGMAAVIITVPVLAFQVRAQNIEPSIKFNPRTYICYRTADSLNIDGKLNEQSWKKAEWTDFFLDIEDSEKPEPRYKTRVKMLWDDRYLYIGSRMEEPDIWATLTKRDAIIFHDNDFEVFIDPDGDTHHYYELEVNAFGTVWDLMLTKPYRDGGQAIDAWDIRGLKVGIHIQGTLNNPADTDSGWTVELAIPWQVLEEAAPEGRPPQPGDQWRINFTRVQWQTHTKDGSYKKKTDTETGQPLAADNWVWSPQGIINMHYPEMWGFVQFSNKDAGAGDKRFTRRKSEAIKWYLRRLYYRQHKYKENENEFASDLEKINAQKLFNRMGLTQKIPELTQPKVYGSSHTFEISITDRKTHTTWYIREDGKVWNSTDN